MLLIIQIALLVISLYALAKGVELKTNARKKPDRMKMAAVCFLVFLILPVMSVGQKDWPPLSYLRSDYRRVSTAAHVRVREAEIVNRIGEYEDWRIVSEVVEPFKGKFRKGDRIEYYHGAEKGFRQELFLGDKIVFLQRNFVEKEKRWVWAVLENSTLRYTLDRARKLRIIKRSTQQHRPARRKERFQHPHREYW